MIYLPYHQKSISESQISSFVIINADNKQLKYYKSQLYSKNSQAKIIRIFLKKGSPTLFDFIFGSRPASYFEPYNEELLNQLKAIK